MVKVDWLVSGGTHCSNGFLRVRTSSPCRTWSAPNAPWVADSSATAHVELEEVEGIRSNSAGDRTLANVPSPRGREDIVVGVSTRCGPVGCCHDRRPSALCEGSIPADCGCFPLSYTHSETVLATIHVVHGRLASHFCYIRRLS
jgi:hypothetical protein